MRRYLNQRPHLLASILVGFLILFLLGWVWITWDSWGYGRGYHQLKGVGTLVGVTGYTLFSLALFLSSRLRFLEKLVGGLDHIYRWHHTMGLWGFYLILVHPWILASKWMPEDPSRFFLFIFPYHDRLSVNLGSIAYLLMVLIIGITIFKLLPYDKWKLTHRFMSLSFLLASLHIILTTKPFDPAPASLAYLFIPMALGFFGIFYKQLYMPLFYRYAHYKVSSTKKMNDNVMEVTLTPKNQPLAFTPGQYAFLSFGAPFSKEQHPFTLCSEKENALSILVKGRGDFTKKLYNDLTPDTEVHIEGPYGTLDYREGSKDQIWIAGGIGIALFLSWTKTLTDWPGHIHLYYCTHRTSDLLFIKECNQNVDLHTFCTENNERLTIEHILKIEKTLENKEIYMCGPKRLTKQLLKELQQRGVKRKNIHFEDFEFF